jgi:predicted AlkP superfamily phosphohydrolase/phosphomutase
MVKQVRKVMVIGLDGATFDNLHPWIKQGYLPYLSELMEHGSWGPLKSIIPPISGPAWASFMTGKNPANHGVFDFFKKRHESYATIPVDSRNIKALSIWDILGEFGKKSILVNVMMTYPPVPMNGLMITGGLTPPNPEIFTYPNSLAEEIQQNVGNYPISARGGMAMIPGREDEFLDKLLTNLRQRIKTSKYLLKNYKWDFFMQLIEGTDVVQHKFWKYYDKNHPRYEPSVYANAILDYYKEVDRCIGSLIEEVDKDTIVCIMSDHGFRGVDKIIQVNNFLHQIGMLNFKPNPKTRIKKLLFGQKSITPLDIYRKMIRWGANEAKNRVMASKKEGKFLNRFLLSVNDIDWNNTKAFSIGSFGQIYINQKGVEKSGIVSRNEYEDVVSEIEQSLMALQDPDTNLRVIDKVFTKKEIYQGRYFDDAPDIVFLTREGYSAFQQEFFTSPSIFHSSGQTGFHSLYGIFILSGKGIKQGKVVGSKNIIDLAPMLLYLLDTPIPQDMDGVIWNDVIEEYLKEKRTVKTYSPSKYKCDIEYGEMSDDEKEQIKKHLRDLGYLD